MPPTAWVLHTAMSSALQRMVVLPAMLNRVPTILPSRTTTATSITPWRLANNAGWERICVRRIMLMVWRYQLGLGFPLKWHIDTIREMMLTMWPPMVTYTTGGQRCTAQVAVPSIPVECKVLALQAGIFPVWRNGINWKNTLWIIMQKTYPITWPKH